MSGELEKAGQSNTGIEPVSATYFYIIIDERIKNATTPAEITMLVKARGEIIKQNESIGDSQHKRQLERVQVFAQYGISSVALGVGAYLATHGVTYPGLFVLGASLYCIAPKFVMKFFKSQKAE